MTEDERTSLEALGLRGETASSPGRKDDGKEVEPADGSINRPVKKRALRALGEAEAAKVAIATGLQRLGLRNADGLAVVRDLSALGIHLAEVRNHLTAEPEDPEKGANPSSGSFMVGLYRVFAAAFAVLGFVFPNWSGLAWAGAVVAMGLGELAAIRRALEWRNALEDERGEPLEMVHGVSLGDSSTGETIRLLELLFEARARGDRSGERIVMGQLNVRGVVPPEGDIGSG